MQVWFDFIRIELLYYTIGPRGEIFEVIRRPPHHEVSISVELRALVVETVRHLMPNHSANAAIIERIINFRIVKRRL